MSVVSEKILFVVVNGIYFVDEKLTNIATRERVSKICHLQ